jgi:hypothetical protein
VTDLARLLATFTRSAWRLEARDTYDISDEREQFDEFVSTGKATPSDEDREFQDFIRGLRASGREIGRVRLVGRPITTYTEFEFAYYPDLVAAGEDVRVVDRADLDDVDGPWDTDFWVFDDEIVAIMNYTDEGKFLGIDLVEESDVGMYLDARTHAIELSCALADYHLPPSGRRRSRVA